jgi:hypothetical protein
VGIAWFVVRLIAIAVDTDKLGPLVGVALISEVVRLLLSLFLVFAGFVFIDMARSMRHISRR